MNILGISAYYHDSAACILVDGVPVAAIEEERFTRVKHDNSFPVKAIKKCLEIAKLSIEQIDLVTYYEKPVKKLERVIETFVATYPLSLEAFVTKMPEMLLNKLDIQKSLRKSTGYKGKIIYVPHHLSHAAAAFYTSPFKSAAILVVDGVGEEETITLWEGKGNALTQLKAINFPHSVGLLYSTFTAFLGFTVNSDEYKMMGLAAYGKPRYLKQVREMYRVDEVGGFELEMRFFSYRESLRQMWCPALENLLGPPRKPGAPFTQRHKDIAASIQQVTEEIYFALAKQLRQITKAKNLCIGGGVALNSLANGKLFAQTKFPNIHIFGAAGDNGAALGCAYVAAREFDKRAKQVVPKNLLLGSVVGGEEAIAAKLAQYGWKYKKFEQEEELLSSVSRKLYQGKVVGWINGKMEFGPRALGSRSILGRTFPRQMKERVNEIKMREMFRPFAVSVLQEEASKWFETPKQTAYFPQMNYCFPVRPSREKQLRAVVHADKTCRIQTVNEAENGRYYRLIKQYSKISGIPCVLNTSFNTKIEPIVESLDQILTDFGVMKLDYLVIENYLIKRS